jgi:L-fucose isomerase
MKRFGVGVSMLDQCEIVKRAASIDAATVRRHMDWICGRASVVLGPDFPEDAFERQVRSYIALRQLTEEYGAAFIAVKCQRELSDGYVCQCVGHLLMNGSEDADGKKKPVVFACESDANGALTMQILHLLSRGGPAALLDVRGLDTGTGRMIVANCGAVPEDMLRKDPESPLSGVSLIRHAFGAGKGGACDARIREGEVTIARLCTKDEKMWIAATKGRVVALTDSENAMIPPSFPRGAIETGFDESFLQEFGSNHVHLVYGDHLDKVKTFCELTRLECRVW